MLEIASQMILCLLLAALLGFIIGYLFGKMTCANDECGHTEESHVDSHGTDTPTSKATTPVHLTENTSTHAKENITDTASKTENSLNNTEIDTSSKSTNTSKNSSTTAINGKDTKSVDTSTRSLTSPRSEGKDNLSRIKGIGAKIEDSLNDIGVYHFDQIAAWDAEDIAWADDTLGFPGRVDREKWVEQAKILAAGGDTEFSKRVDEGKVESSK